MIRSKDVIEKMKNTGTPDVIILKNVLNKENIESLLNLYQKFKEMYPKDNKARATNTSRKNEITIVRDEHHQDIHEIIGSKLNILPFKYDTINFYRIENPYHLHTDTGKNNRISYMQGVIPLETDPVNTGKTVIFDQKAYFSSEYIFPNLDKPSNYEPFHNIGTWDPSVYEGWTDEYKISEDQAKEIWYDKWKFWIERYKGFSIKEIYHWNVGDILLFNRTLLHASSLMKEAGVNYKSGLLFLTYLEN